MSKTPLNAVAIDVVTQYGLAGKYLVEAYRVGTQRTVAQLSGSYTAFVNGPSLPILDESFRKQLVSAHAQMTGLVVGGVTRATQQADHAIDRLTDLATGGIERVATAGQRAAVVVGAPVVDTMAKAQLPVAQLSLRIAGQVVAGTKRLVEQVGTVDDVVAAAAAPKARAHRATA